MTIEATSPETTIRAMAHRFVDEVVNGRQFHVMEELYAPDAIITVPVRFAAIYGQETYQGIVREMTIGFPDFHADLVELVVDQSADGGAWYTGRPADHMAMLCLRATGTHTAELFGIPPKGRKASWVTVHMWHLSDGRIVRDHVLADFLSLFAHLGLVRPPGRAPTGGRRPR